MPACTAPIKSEHGVVSCRRCDMCKRYARHQKIGRAVAQAATSQHVFFGTLTFRDEDLHLARGDIKELYKKYIRNLRNYGYKVSHYGVFELGEKRGRPHLHVVLFFSDRGKTPEMDLDVRMDMKHWLHGFSHYAAVRNVGAAMAYVMDYLNKPGSVVLSNAQGFGKQYILNFAAMLGRNRRPLMKNGSFVYTEGSAKGHKKGKDGQKRPFSWEYVLPRNHPWMALAVDRYLDGWGEKHDDQPPAAMFEGLPGDW